MSGTEAAGLILGLISASITIIDATAKLYDGAHDATGLPPAFREVAARIPLVLEILRKAEEQLKAGKVKEDTCNAVQAVMKQCKLKSEKLSNIFKEVVPGENTNRFERYVKAAKMLGKGSRVEDLMLGILADIQLLAGDRSMGAATDEQFEQLSNTIAELKKLDSSLPEESETVSVAHTGSGHNIVATGSSKQPVNLGSGPQNINDSGGGAFHAPTYHAPVHQNYGSHTSFTFLQPNMMAERTEHYISSKNRMDEPKRVYIMAPPRNENFVVRDVLDQQLMTILPLDSSASIAIWGLGGCGKTQLALNYAYQRQQKTNCSIFWIRADSSELFAASYGSIAKEADLPPTLTADEELRAVRKWIERRSSWLMVVDNADDLDESRCQYLEHVPQPASSESETGAVLWTTRDAGILYRPYGISRGIDASIMQSSDSLLLYRKLLHRERPLYPEEYALPASVDEVDLLHELGDLPLAISQAAAFIRKNGNIRRYVDRLRKSEAEASKLLLRDQKDPDRRARQNSVMKTWIVSLERLGEEQDVGANAIQILYTVAFLDNQGITLELLQHSVGMDVDRDDLQDAIARLVEYSFLQYQEDVEETSRTYSQHKLVSMAMRHRVTSEGSRSTHAAHTFRGVLHCFPSEKHDTADQCRIYVPHALMVLSETDCTDFQKLADQLLPFVTTSHVFHGRYDDARLSIERWLELQDQLPGSSDILRLEAQSALGWIHGLQGEFDQAEKILSSTLSRQKGFLGQDDPAIWITTSYLARAVLKLGQYKRAKALQLQVLDYHKLHSGPAALDTKSAMNNLATIYRYQENWDEAEKICMDILKELAKADPKRSVLALSTQNNLALVFKDRGDFVEAEKLLKITIQESKDKLGDSHPDTITFMHNLFSVYTMQGRTTDAQVFGSEVEQLSRTVLGDKHPVFLSVSYDLHVLKFAKIGIETPFRKRPIKHIIEPTHSGETIANQPTDQPEDNDPIQPQPRDLY